jgi:hypothetical protein
MRLLTIAAVTLCGLFSAGATPVEDSAVRAKLMGEWQQSDGNGVTKATWTLKETGSSIHLSNSANAAIVMDFDCNTEGKECTVKHSGHSSKVSIWFNGAKLVELETTGSQVVKRRFTVTGDGDSMELETIPMVPTGPAETTHFKRISGATARE